MIYVARIFRAAVSVLTNIQKLRSPFPVVSFMLDIKAVELRVRMNPDPNKYTNTNLKGIRLCSIGHMPTMSMFVNICPMTNSIVAREKLSGGGQ